MPGAFYIDGKITSVQAASWLSEYFEYANDVNSNCAANPVVQKRGKALGECLVWLVAGWPGTDPVIYAVGGEGNCSGQDCGKTLAFDLNGPMTTTWRAQFRKRIDRDWLMPTLEALLPSN